MSTFRRYRRFFGNHDIEYSYVDIEVTVFDIDKNVDIVIFDIDVNVDIGGGKVPDVIIRLGFGATGRGRVTLAAAQALPGLGDPGLRRMRLHCGWRAAR